MYIMSSLPVASTGEVTRAVVCGVWPPVAVKRLIHVRVFEKHFINPVFFYYGNSRRRGRAFETAGFSNGRLFGERRRMGR